MASRATSRSARPVALATLVATVAIAAHAGAVAIAAQAGAVVPRPFFGVNLEPTASNLDFQRLGRARAGTARLPFLWYEVEPTKGAPRDWRLYDRLMEQAADAGIEVLPALAGTPTYATPSFYDPPKTRSARAGFARFARDAVARYGTTGTFWRDHPEVPYQPVKAWQVWNEPNFGLYWHNKPNPNQYATLLANTARAIRGADPTAKVVLGGLTYGGGKNRMERYLAALYRVPRASLYFDVVAIHPYARDWRGVIGSIQRVRQAMNHAGDPKTTILVTEIGWATGFKGSFNSTSPSGQAKHLTDTFRALVRVRNRYRVSGVSWWTFRDPNVKFDYWAYYCGLFQANGHPKPAWNAFRRFSLASR